jgi:hypothetical protein
LNIKYGYLLAIPLIYGGNRNIRYNKYMSRTRDLSRVLSGNTGLVSNDELDVILESYLTEGSASTIYATQASLSTIDSDNNPDILMVMGA